MKTKKTIFTKRQAYFEAARCNLAAESLPWECFFRFLPKKVKAGWTVVGYRSKAL